MDEDLLLAKKFKTYKDEEAIKKLYTKYKIYLYIFINYTARENYKIILSPNETCKLVYKFFILFTNKINRKKYLPINYKKTLQKELEFFIKRRFLLYKIKTFFQKK